jgi:5-methyltetrahydrofolate--homocysteine methyltransferase
MLDVNAGIPLADEPRILGEAIQLVQSVVDVPISIDSSIVEALERGLAVVEGKPLLNSITGEDERLEHLLPLVKKYGCAFIGISNDETGISEDPDVRFAVAKKIVERAMDYGIPKADVLIDPLVMPIGAMASAGSSVFRILNRCRDELRVNTCCGASNSSFGLPNRPALNGTFLAMAISNGLTSAITNPIEHEIKQGIQAADVFMGHDANCLTWIQANRQPSPPGAEPSSADQRRKRRERRPRREQGGS